MSTAVGSSITTPAATTGAASLSVRGVTVTYPNGNTALHDASFRLGPGTICALVGVNGSGKSTLFKAIMGFVTPSAGEVEISGLSARQAQKRNLVAYVPQSEDVDWNFPVLVEDVVTMGRYGHMGFTRTASAEDRRKVTEALERVGMVTYRFRQIGELSGGQRKRVFLARALAQQGQLVLLDEPFTGVDVRTEGAIIELMRAMKAEGYVILVSTHNLGSVPDFCDQVVLLNRTVLAAGPTSETFTQSNLERAFGGLLRHFRIAGSDLHDDDDMRSVTVLTDDERPVVFYGERKASDQPLANAPKGEDVPQDGSKDTKRETKEPAR